MKLICRCLLVWALVISVSHAQRQLLKGKLVAAAEVEGIHILNKTGLKYTISDTDGTFEILAQKQDTLVVSSLKYNLETIVVSNTIISEKRLVVKLTEHINTLDDVIVGQVLTGNLESDVQNSKAKPSINFYDLGLPGYKGKPLSINERKLFDADGGGAGLNLHKLLNIISGRTKKLKAIVLLDKKENCSKHLNNTYSNLLTQNHALPKEKANEFFQFLSEDSEFLRYCNANELDLINFLFEQLDVFKERLKP